MKKHNAISLVSSTLLLISCLLCLSACKKDPSSMSDMELVTEVDREASLEHWDNVIELTQDCWGKTTLAYFRNLAFAHKGLLADSLMHHYAPFDMALFLPVDDRGNGFSITAASEVWWRLKVLTMAEHATILGMTFSENPKSERHIRRLYEINIASGNQPAANKYRRMLEAYDYEVPADIKPFDNAYSQDTLQLSGQYQMMLRTLLNQSEDKQGMAYEYLLCLDLLKKDVASFRKDIEAYGFPKYCPLYQEGMLLTMMNFHDLRDKWADRISPEYYQKFDLFGKLVQTGNKRGLSIFRNSYWYYFRFAKSSK